MKKLIFSTHEKHQANRFFSIQEAVGLFSDTLWVIVWQWKLYRKRSCQLTKNPQDGLKGTTRWAVYYFTNPNSWYPLLETGKNGGNSCNSPFVPLSERNLARRTGQPRTLWLRGAARKQQKTRRIGRWNIIVRFPVWWWLHGDIPSLEREADFYLGRWKSASKEVFASTAV